MSLDVVVLAFEHVETLVRQRPVGQQRLDVVHNHLSERAVHTPIGVRGWSGLPQQLPRRACTPEILGAREA